MGSQIASIYDALGAWTFSVTIGGVAAAVTALWDDTLSKDIPDALLPVRVLTPVEDSLEGDGLQFVTFGASPVGRVDWIVRDVLLVKPITQGRGLPEVAPALVQYVADYAAKLQTARRILSTPSKATIVRADPLPGVIEWPIGGERYFQGVEWKLTITEVF